MMYKWEDWEVNFYYDERDLCSVRERLFFVYECYVNSVVEFVILNGVNGLRKLLLCWKFEKFNLEDWDNFNSVMDLWFLKEL